MNTRNSTAPVMTEQDREMAEQHDRSIEDPEACYAAARKAAGVMLRPRAAAKGTETAASERSLPAVLCWVARRCVLITGPARVSAGPSESFAQ